MLDWRQKFGIIHSLLYLLYIIHLRARALYCCSIWYSDRIDTILILQYANMFSNEPNRNSGFCLKLLVTLMLIAMWWCSALLNLNTQLRAAGSVHSLFKWACLICCSESRIIINNNSGNTNSMQIISECVAYEKVCDASDTIIFLFKE